MIACPTCSSSDLRKYGSTITSVMTKRGRRNVTVQKYQCVNKHLFRSSTPPSFDPGFIDHVVYVYLRCLSLNTTIDIIRETYEEDVLTKALILDFIAMVADALPTLTDIDVMFVPKRSGFLAFDGVWFSYNDVEIVLLVCFDPVSFDIVAAQWFGDENYGGYTALLTRVLRMIPSSKIIGIYGDGDLGLLKALGEQLPNVPFQLCVVHKELKMGKLVPVKSVYRSKRMTSEKKAAILLFQELFRNCLYANTKEEAKKNLVLLKAYARAHPYAMFHTAYRSLVHNFALTLTHFDHPHMERDNNVLECFNGILKPRLDLMKSFKKKDNLDRYLKLFLLEYRFRPLRESRFTQRRGQSPLALGQVYLPKYYNFITFLRDHFKLTYE